MHLQFLDWAIIVAFLLTSLLIGLKYKSQAGKSLTDFFLGGRNLPWYIAGTSMVATTFAADTPLWVTEKIAQHGISGNWMWWNMLIGGMLTTFFFSRLWRRANILTELEFIELRYSGKPAKFLRGFKSVYLGIFLNAVVIGWVNAAMMKILEVFFEIPAGEAFWWVGAIMVLVVVYSSVSGLKGVAITDTLQFIIAMTGCIILAVYVLGSKDIGGIGGLKEKLGSQSWRLDFFPKLNMNSSHIDVISVFSLSIGAFFSYMSVQWWACWYPGAEPGGGGYIAQRMMSTKNEKHAIYSTLFFQIAHYCLRPWPWIIVGLCTVVLYPELSIEQSGKGYVFAMRDYLPVGMTGLMLAAFLGAYMSTISTQLNWGASYLTNDLYKRFIKPAGHFKDENKAQKHYVMAARVFTALIMFFALYATTQIESIDGAAQFLINCGAGLGLVLILRWYWWRVNAWSEIVATFAPFLAYSLCFFWLEDYAGPGFIKNNGTMFVTVGFTTAAWIIATYLTKPVDIKTLSNFYQIVRPDGIWDESLKPKHTYENSKKSGKMIDLTLCWVAAIVMTYSTLFFTGYVILHDWNHSLVWFVSGITAFFIFRKMVIKIGIFENEVLKN